MEVAILGGGIAGLATAISLQQKGMNVSVYERRRSVQHLGAGVVCWPNASFVLSELGLLDELRAVSGAVTGMQRFSSDGARLGRLDVRDLDRAMGFPSLSVLRGDLMRLLLRRAEASAIPIHFSCRAIAIDHAGHRCRVRFADGTSVTPDLILGADGRMDSIARRFVTGENRPVFQSFVNWIGVARHSASRADATEIGDYWGVGARFGIVPVSPDTAYWAGGVAISEDMPHDANESIALLRRTFEGWPQPIGDVIAQASKSNVKQVALYDHDPVSVWHKQNVLLIGDAAHAALPTSGQGAAQALEDAWCLSQEITNSSADLESALARFTQQRQKKTTGVSLAGRAFAAVLFSKDPDECAKRNYTAVNTDYAAMAAQMASGWGAGLPISPDSPGSP